MIYLLDTNAISDLMRSDSDVEQWLAGLGPEDHALTSAIVRGETLFGISKVPRGKRRTELEHTAHRFLDRFHCEEISPRTADYYAELKSAQRFAGRPLDENDLWIAATAMALGATVVSRDSDFRRIEGLPVVEPRYQ